MAAFTSRRALTLFAPTSPSPSASGRRLFDYGGLTLPLTTSVLRSFSELGRGRYDIATSYDANAQTQLLRRLF